MIKIPAFDSISYLVGRRFPGFNGQEAEARLVKQQEQKAAAEQARRASAMNIGSFSKSNPSNSGDQELTPAQRHAIDAAREIMKRENEASTYRDQLLTATEERIEALVIDERKKEADEIRARIEAEEMSRFFHQPRATADYRHYCKLANWTLDEAIALSLCKNPNVVNWKSVSSFVQVSPFAKEYEKRRDITARAKWAGQLFDPVMPGILLRWAKTKFEPIPAELLGAALDNGISLRGWQDLYEDLAKKFKTELANQATQNQNQLEEMASLYESQRADAFAKLKTTQLEIENLKIAAQTVSAASEKPLQTRERENLQLMALLGAIRGYGYDPDKGRNTATMAISNDFSDLSLSFSDDRIRDHLKAAFELVPPGWRQRWKSKPHPGKS